MANAEPFKLTVFVVDGDPDGLRLVDRSNWNGKAVIFPRVSYPQVRDRQEFQQPGVYLLLGPRQDGDGEALYIGEGDPVRPRLDDHYANKDFWNRAVFFVAGPGELNKAHVQYLESQLVARAKAAKRVHIANGNTPFPPSLSESDRAITEVFLNKILGMLPVLAIQAFEQSATVTITKNVTVELICEGKGVKAIGYEAPQGFIVKAGSSVSKSETPSLKEHFPSMCKLRADLIETGVLVDSGADLKFTQDYTFSSPSTASAVVLARSSNGRLDWKDATGKTLKEIQEAQAHA